MACLAYFGYPRASEDDAERAVNAGLTLVESVGRASRRHRAAHCRRRVGIASGLVLIGDLIAAGAPHDHDVVGETPNLAARLQAYAEPNTVIISGETRRLVGELFECAPSTPSLSRASRRRWNPGGSSSASEIVNRFRALRTPDTPLVGREQETDLDDRRWEKRQSGKRPRLADLAASPASGSRAWFRRCSSRLGHEPHVRMRYFCAPNRQDSALYPVIAQLERAAGIDA